VWDHRIVLVGDSLHALSGAFGSRADFAMEDGWISAQWLAHFVNDLSKALSLSDQIRRAYRTHMYAHLMSEAARRAKNLQDIGSPSFDDEGSPTKFWPMVALTCLGFMRTISG
jgi:2-polyprenyl-6-methoxyphenol hydroxylase-like FAD-dependent oxidoreductase